MEKTLMELVNKLCAAEHTNGMMQQEIDTLTADLEKAKEEIDYLRKEVSEMSEKLDDQKALWTFTYDEKERYKRLYEATIPEVAEDAGL